MLFPYSTDAPIYHWPAATVGLIAVNTVVFIAELAALQSPEGEELIKAWCLELGGGVHPVQWVTANFLHAGVLHLVGNMFGVWAFGLIVEGKIGWLRFLTGENWDLFSVWAGRHTMSEEDRAALDRKKREARLSEADVLARRQQTQEAALGQISALVDEGNLQLAMAANARMANQFDDWLLPEPVLYKLLASCFRKDQNVDPVPLAVAYLRHYTKAAVVVRLKLAETLIRKQQRPTQAMRVLSKLPRTGLNDKEEAFRRGLEKEAAAAAKSGPMELAAEDW